MKPTKTDATAKNLPDAGSERASAAELSEKDLGGIAAGMGTRGSTIVTIDGEAQVKDHSKD